MLNFASGISSASKDYFLSFTPKHQKKKKEKNKINSDLNFA